MLELFCQIFSFSGSRFFPFISHYFLFRQKTLKIPSTKMLQLQKYHHPNILTTNQRPVKNYSRLFLYLNMKLSNTSTIGDDMFREFLSSAGDIPWNNCSLRWEIHTLSLFHTITFTYTHYQFLFFFFFILFPVVVLRMSEKMERNKPFLQFIHTMQSRVSLSKILKLLLSSMRLENIRTFTLHQYVHVIQNSQDKTWVTKCWILNSTNEPRIVNSLDNWMFRLVCKLYKKFKVELHFSVLSQRKQNSILTMRINSKDVWYNNFFKKTFSICSLHLFVRCFFRSWSFVWICLSVCLSITTRVVRFQQNNSFVFLDQNSNSSNTSCLT